MMHDQWQRFLRGIIATLAVALAGCTGRVLPGTPEEPRVLDLFSLLRLADDAEVAADTPDPQTECIVPGEPATIVQKRMFRELNDYREKHGLPPLIYSKALEAAADAHLRDMYERGYFDHITPENLTPGNRAVAMGFCHEYVGENLAAGQRNMKAAMRAWDRSPPHQLNMLEPNYVYVGMGHFVDPLTGRQSWAQEFAFDLPQ